MIGPSLFHHSDDHVDKTQIDPLARSGMARGGIPEVRGVGAGLHESVLPFAKRARQIDAHGGQSRRGAGAERPGGFSGDEGSLVGTGVTLRSAKLFGERTCKARRRFVGKDDR